MDVRQFFKPAMEVMAEYMEHLVTDGKQVAWHIKRGGKVLLVAHIDTVHEPKIHKITKKTIIAQGLDDRLGVFMAMALMNARDDVDVLITDDEEVGKSSAALIPTEDLNYNCIIGLDRGGMDFVDYDLADDDLIDAYSEFAEFGYGSFSDICFLNDPPCGCINVGIGYQKAHSKDSYAKIADIKQSYKNVCKFLDKHVDTHFEKHSRHYDFYDDYVYEWEEDDAKCEFCEKPLTFEEELEKGLCLACLDYFYVEYWERTAQ